MSNGDDIIIEGDDGAGSGSPTNFSQLLMFQIGRINTIGSSEGLIYDKIKASTYNNAVEELEGLLENHIRKDKYYYKELKEHTDQEKKDIKSKKDIKFSVALVGLSRAKLRCLYAVMGRHNLFPQNRSSIRV